MESILSAFNNWDQEQQRILDICERVAGFVIKRGEYLMTSVYDGSQIVMFESLDEVHFESMIMRFCREDGVTVEQCLKRGEDGFMFVNPERKQEATARCEQVNVGLMVNVN
jgi:hypothetical protein